MRSMHAAPAPAHPHTCLGRTWNLVNDKSLDRVITWSKDGRSFIVKQPSILSTYLPKTLGLFKATFPSFLCEMNIYVSCLQLLLPCLAPPPRPVFTSDQTVVACSAPRIFFFTISHLTPHSPNLTQNTHLVHSPSSYSDAQHPLPHVNHPHTTPTERLSVRGERREWNTRGVCLARFRKRETRLVEHRAPSRKLRTVSKDV
mmetsp:Transcript_4523/g.11156  ORF Transcript_4523/g.11156 Transcript_4523/m.11156 type:complete len:201 (-) Transcript_4523:523-1125(-)